MIHPWQKIGGPQELAKRFGKSLYIQNLRTSKGNKLEWVFFRVHDFSMVLPITENLEVITVKQYRPGSDTISHELPAGSIETYPETYSDLITRELEEETGYKAGEITKLGTFPIHTASSPTLVYLFLATGCTPTGQIHTDQNEEIEVKLVPLKEWVEMALDGEIKEPWSSLTTMLAIKNINKKLGLKFDC